MLSDDPPSSDEVTSSLTCRDSTEVNTLTSSGIIAPASVPQEMMVESFHHNVPSPPRSGMISLETMKVRVMETNEVIQTSEVSGFSKFISSELDRKSTRLNSSHITISYAVFCLKKKKKKK